MDSSIIKCVIVIDENLPLGLIANSAAVLALTLGKEIEGIIGGDICDGSGIVHRGITRVTFPILKADADTIRQIRNSAQSMIQSDDLFIVDFSDAAQTTKTYDEYESKIGATSAENLKYLGIAIYGDKKKVSKLTGNLPLLR